MNIRQILAGGLAAIAAGATLGVGVFGAGLGDYVTTDTNELLSPMVVIGGSSAAPPNAADVLGGIDVGVALAGFATTDVSIAGATGVPAVSNGALISSDLNKTYLGKAFTQVLTSLTATDLPVLLGSTSFTDMNNTKTTITQQLAVGAQTVAYGRPGTEETPGLYTTFGPSYTYNLTVLFIGGLDTSAIDSTYSLSLFDKDYTFGATTTGISLHLYSSTGASTLTLEGTGAEADVTIEGSDYTFVMKGYEAGTPNKAYFYVNGQPTSPYGWNAGSTYTIPGTNINVYISTVSIIYTDPQTASATAQLFVGTDKLELVHGQNVEKNDESMSQIKTYFDNTTTKINSITFTVAPDINTYLMDGGEFVDPLFGSFKWILGNSGTTPAKESMDKIGIQQSGSNKVKLTFTNKDGIVYAQDVFTYDSQNTVWRRSPDGTYNFIVTEANVSEYTGGGVGRIGINDVFVVNNNYNTYILKYVSYHTSSTTSLRYVTLQDVSTLTKYDIYYNSDNFLRIGAETFNVSMEDYAGTFDIAVDLSGDGTIQPTDVVNITTQNQGIIEFSSNKSIVAWEVPLYDITEQNEPIATKINTTVAWASNDINFNVVGASTYQVGTSNVYNGMTNYGSLVVTDTDADTVDIWHPGKRPAYANVAVGINPTITVGGETGSTVKQAVQIQQPIAKFASEVSDPASITSDLILIGGPCANSLVATLMETTLDTCFDDFKAYNGGITDGIIKEFAAAFGSGQKALIVAGMDAADTRAMAAKVMQGTLDYQA